MNKAHRTPYTVHHTSYLVCRLSFAALFLLPFGLFAQTYSFSTDLGLLRQASPRQSFWGLTHRVRGEAHFSDRHSAVAWLAYATPGYFTNVFGAPARNAIGRQEVPVRARWRYREVALAWKPYFRGGYREEERTSLYGVAGLGLLFTRIDNTYGVTMDTSFFDYSGLPLPGQGDFRRLTVSLGLGGEYSPAAGYFLFTEARATLPASDYPYPYLHDFRAVPRALFLTAGLRMHFE